MTDPSPASDTPLPDSPAPESPLPDAQDDETKQVLAGLHAIAVDGGVSVTARVSAGKTFLEYTLGKPRSLDSAGGDGAFDPPDGAVKNGPHEGGHEGAHDDGMIRVPRDGFEAIIKSSVEQAISCDKATRKSNRDAKRKEGLKDGLKEGPNSARRPRTGG